MIPAAEGRSRRRKLVAVAVAVLALALVPAARLLLTPGRGTNSRSAVPTTRARRNATATPGFTVPLLGLAPIAGAAARAATLKDLSPTSPLGRLEAVGSALAEHHSLPECRHSYQALGQAGPPPYLRAIAAELPDAVAADLAGTVVTAVVQVLNGCASATGPAPAAVLLLRRATATLGARLKEDAQ